MRSLPKFCLVLGLLSVMGEYSVANGLTHRGDGQAIGGCHPHQWASEISLAKNRFTLAVDGCRFTFRGDESDRGQVLIDVGGRAQPLIYQLWPDLAKWRLTAEGKVLYAKEFEGMSGWRERTIRICVDAVRSTRRVWVDGRLVKAWRAPTEAVPRLVVAGPDLGEAFSCRDPKIGVSPFLTGERLFGVRINPPRGDRL